MTDTVSLTGTQQSASVSASEQSADVPAKEQTTAIREIDLTSAFLFIRTTESETIESNTTTRRGGVIMETDATLTLQQDSTLVIA